VSNSRKIKQLLDFCCQDIFEILDANRERATAFLLEDGPYSDGFIEFAEWLLVEEKELLRPCIEASSFADLTLILVETMGADGEFESEELEEAASLVSQSCYRYFWLKDYQKYDGGMSVEKFIKYFKQWNNDSFWIGGDFGEGAVRLPFKNLVILACFATQSVEPFQNYAKCFQLIAKTIFSHGGWSSEEKNYYSTYVGDHRNTEEVLSRLLSEVNCLDDEDEVDIELLEGRSKALSKGSPESVLAEGLAELESLVGVASVKKEVSELSNFLNIRQHRIAQGMSVQNQSLHFVFTGNPGTGKTTVARILSKILFGFGILKRPEVIECSRASLVGGYLGQTAIKTNETIDQAIHGVLFIDEAYTLSQKNNGMDDSYGKEAIDTLLKRMEDDRDKLVVIVAGYPELMNQFLSTNPGLQSRFTRFIHFEDYHVSDMCRIFNGIAEMSNYKLSQEAKANLAIFFNFAYSTRAEGFGNARFVRNAFELTTVNHANRLSSVSELTRQALVTIEQDDIPFHLTGGSQGPFEVSKSKWFVKCPKCEKIRSVGLPFIGQLVTCTCGSKFRCPWWNLDEKTVDGIGAYQRHDRVEDFVGFDADPNDSGPAKPVKRTNG